MTERARYEGRLVVVTGGGRGIGAAIARSFGREGARVVIAEVISERGERMASQLRGEGLSALAIATDVSDPDSVGVMAQRVLSELGTPDVLVNNAGIAVFGDPQQLALADWRRCLAVDLDGAWYCSQALLSAMTSKGGGSIVNIASVHSFKIVKGCFPYPVAKHGVIGLTRALAVDCAPHVRVNAVCPGWVDTEINAEQFERGGDPVSERGRIAAMHPMARIGMPEDVAAATLFLASDEASFITGESLVVDGGRSILFQD